MLTAIKSCYVLARSSRTENALFAGKRAAARPYPTDASEAEVERMEAAIEVIAELQLTAEQLKVGIPC